MKYAIQAHCEKKYLEEADEIIINHKEIKRLNEYETIYPDKQFTIHCYKMDTNDIDWGFLAEKQKKFSKTFTVGVDKFSAIAVGQEWGFKVYMLKFINNFAELSILKEAGVCFVYLDQPLFSSLDKVKKFEIPIRWIPNLADAGPGYLERKIHGTWIRPEDLDEYDIIDGCIAEFISHNGILGEQAAFNVYKKEKEWSFDFGLMFPEFKDQGIDNFLIDPELVKHRMNCHQRCEEVPYGNGCHICDHVFKIANKDLITDYLNSEKQPLY